MTGDGQVTITYTVVGRVIRGGPGNDRLRGGRGNDRIYGGGGNDIIRGGAGNDVLDGGPGRDTIYGGRGEDLIWGGPGNDTIYGGRGYDLIYGGPGNDRIVDHRGPATVFPGLGTNQVNVTDGQADDRVVCRPGSINHIVADRGDQITPSCRGKGSTVRFQGAPQPSVAVQQTTYPCPSDSTTTCWGTLSASGLPPGSSLSGFAPQVPGNTGQGVDVDVQVGGSGNVNTQLNLLCNNPYGVTNPNVGVNATSVTPSISVSAPASCG